MYPHQDRSPLICPAGVKHVREWSVPDCLQEYSLQEKLDVVIKGFKKEPPPVVKTKLNPIRYAGIYTEIKNVLTPEPPSGFKMLLEDLGETTYHSYWNKPLGKGRDPRPLLPPGVTNESRYFGKPPVKGEALYPIILPEKNQCQVLKESRIGKDLYRKTHAKYDPSERINREYCKPFNPNATFGVAKDNLKNGVEKCLRWRGLDYYAGIMQTTQNLDLLGDCEPPKDEAKHLETIKRIRALGFDEGLPVVSEVSAILGDRIDRFEDHVGSGAAPNSNYLKVPSCFTYGIPRTETQSVASLLRDKPISPKLVRMQECIAHVNSVRKLLRRRNEQLPYEDIRDQLLFMDKEKCGWLPFYTVVKFLKKYNVFFDHKCIVDIFKHLGDILPLCPEAAAEKAKDPEEIANKLRKEKLQKYSCQENPDDFSDMMIDYSKLVDMIDCKKHLTELGNIDDTSRDDVHYKTTYTAFTLDHQRDVHKDLLPAGNPSIRVDKADPVRPAKGCVADIDNLGDESSAASVVFPSIMSLYGVNHRDFFLPREGKVIKGIFERTGVEFPDNTFDVIFEESCKADCFPGKPNMCCIETFRNHLHKLAHEYYNATT